MEQSSAAREKLWSSLGTLEPFALSQNLSAAAATGPKWPALQQSFRLIHRPNGSVLLVSDGLSDPFDDVQESELRAVGRRVDGGDDPEQHPPCHSDPTGRRSM